ncbi:hypothetical protein D0T12_10595 [Actinomadura spongiicola]|uniref:Uncharacterized protein n=1 Tax=Actinomadura spongiicola TaxID=2303421 RepID=A0A372GJB8_9ACTN|nr:hypothetical protein [Actinomadura spongiicola]RFS85476.1 hypothetical protein D0T12_10595 [Actinomadura spongiicola]
MVDSVKLEDFAGTSDDQRLTKALSYVAAQTYKPAILLAQHRQYVFAKRRMMFDGFALAGPPVSGSEFRYNGKVKVNVPGSGWLDMTGSQLKGISIKNLSFEGNKETTFFVDKTDQQTVLWASHLENLGFSLFKHVIWGAHTAVTFSGYWDVNNCYDTEFKLWGSDNNYWPDGMLLDSPNHPPGERYHIRLPHLSKSNIGPVFVTGKHNVTPMRVDGGRGLVVSGARLEAQQGNPTWGSQLIITGGKFLRFRDVFFFNGMGKPGSTGHPSASLHRGVVTMTGGTDVVFSGCVFSGGDGQQTTSTPPGTPHLYVAGGRRIRIRDHQSSDAPRIVRSTKVPAAEFTTDPDLTVTTG